MPRVDDSIVIRRPVEDVYAFVMDQANEPVWLSMAEARELEGPLQVGTTLRGVDKFLGRRMEWTAEVTEHEPNRLSAIRSSSGPIRFEGRYEFEPADGGTRFSFHLDGEPGLGGIFGKLADPLVTKIFQRQLRSDLEKLKDLLEAQAVPAPGAA